MDELHAKGAVGDMSGRSFNFYGAPVVTDLDERITVRSLDDLKTISLVIAVAEDEDRGEAILGSFRGSYLDVLVVDKQTAEKVTKPRRGRLNFVEILRAADSVSSMRSRKEFRM